MKKPDYTSDSYKKKVMSTIDSIYDLTNSSPMNVGYTKIGGGTIMKDCCRVLIDAGILVNKGSKTRPSYIWNSYEQPNESLCDEVMQYMHSTDAVEFSEPTCTMSDSLGTENTSIIKDLEIHLAHYTDQQLWDELKARGYIIHENQLAKYTFLE